MKYKHVIALDFETYYNTADKYTLSRRDTTAESYINDSRFQVIMCGVMVDGVSAGWRSPLDPDFEDWLRSFPWRESVALAHNGAFFDFLILAWIYGIHPAFYLDTVLMARPLAGINESSSLASLAERFGLPAKGDEVHNADGMRLEHFTSAQLARYGDYCMRDIDICWALAHELVQHWPCAALGWMDITCRMMAQPMFELDGAILREGLRDEAAKEGQQLAVLARAMEQSQIQIPCDKKGVPLDLKKVVGSAEMFADLLRGFKVDPPTKWSDKQEKYVYAFAKSDDFIRETLEDGSEYPGVTEAVQARVGVKSTIMASRLERLVGIADRIGVLPIPLMPFAAHTGRNGGTQKVNVQNLSSRKSASNPLGKRNKLRLALKATPGYFIADADMSQVEVRVLGAVSGEMAILNSFANPAHDPYCIFGSTLYGRPIIKGVDKRERDVSKAAVLGNGFGQGWFGFMGYCKRTGLEVSEEEAKRTVDVYRAAHPAVVEFWAQCEWALKTIVNKNHGTFGYKGCLRVVDDGIMFPSGRVLRYRGLQWGTRPHRFIEGKTEKVLSFWDPVKRMRRMVYGSLTCENIVQGVASDIVQEAAVALHHRHNITTRLQVHDALVFVEPMHRMAEICRAVPHEMTQRPSWMPWIPLAMEMEIGPSYGELEEVQFRPGSAVVQMGTERMEISL